MVFKISIVTVNYNDSYGLEKTINSIREQAFKGIDFELIIIDGKSTDASLDVIIKNNDIIDKYVTEKDNGIYDAMNKGLDFCTGNYVLFLNSGDYFSEVNDFNLLLSTIKNNDKKVIFWSAKILSENDYWYYPSINNSISINSWLKSNLPNHQAMLFPKHFYSVNKYDLSMIINADADYKIRAIKKFDVCYIPISYTTFVLGGVSSQKLSWKSYKIRINDMVIYESKHSYGFNKHRNIAVGFLKYTVKLVLSNILSSKIYFNLIKK